MSRGSEKKPGSALMLAQRPMGLARQRVSSMVAMVAIAIVGVGCSVLEDAPEVERISAAIMGKHPAIIEVRPRVDLLDRPLVVVEIVDGSTDATAREVWCNVIVVGSFDDTVDIRVTGSRDGKRWWWPQPRDCSNQEDVPRPRR